MSANENAPKIKGVADVVFVLDVSGTMSDIVQGVKDHISNFVGLLVNDPQSTVKDVRLGLVTHDVGGAPNVFAAPFTSSPDEFRRNVNSAPDGASEYGLPAIDKALDFPWRESCRRYVVFFTDEDVDGGNDPQLQKSKLIDLCRKLTALHVHFVGFGPSCNAYEMVGKTPGSTYRVTTHDELSSIGLDNVLQGIAKTITASLDQKMMASVPRNLYGI